MNAVESNRKELEERNYVRKAEPGTNYWFSFYFHNMKTIQNKSGDNFYLIICGNPNDDSEYFNRPMRCWISASFFWPRGLSRPAASLARPVSKRATKRPASAVSFASRSAEWQ